MPGAAGTSRRRGAGDDRGDTQQPSARRPQEGDRGAIRGLFRRLAEALHPDRVQDEQDKATRTEVMKQIAVAYHAGDFARLVEIERTWATSGAPLATDDEGELERRLAAMERANEELRKQLRAIDRDLRLRRNSGEGQLARNLKRRRDAGQETSVTGEVEQDLQGLRRMLEFVRSFRDGQISLAKFLDGPDAKEEAGDAEMLEALAALAMLMGGEGIGAQPKRNRRRGKGASSRASRRGP